MRTVQIDGENRHKKRQCPASQRRAVAGVRTAGINEFIDRSFNFLVHGQAGEIATFETLFPINRFNNFVAYTFAVSSFRPVRVYVHFAEVLA